MLKIANLTTKFTTPKEEVIAVDNISFELEKGEILGVIGESGSGKTITSFSIINLLDNSGEIVAGSIEYRNKKGEQLELTQLTQDELTEIRGKEISFIFQEPMSALNPVLTCGDQLIEGIIYHQKINQKTAKKKALDLLEKVQIKDPERIFQAYPHQLSGGQLQRVVIAIALMNDPQLLIADEPTTALDYKTQLALLDLLKTLKKSLELTILFISHDLNVIEKIADKVLVMHEGKIVESGSLEVILNHPKEAYTKMLIHSNEKLKKSKQKADFSNVSPILEIKNLKIYYPKTKNWLGQPKTYVKAVENFSFDLKKGQILGLVGPSGCGKTSIARSIVKLEKPIAGQILFENTNLLLLSDAEMHSYRKKIQIIFQDPFASLNPRMKIGEAILEPIQFHQLAPTKKVAKEMVLELLKKVGLKPAHYHRYPTDFSGGERQRISIARALAVQPEVLICDEIVSSLDKSIQSTILDLLLDLRSSLGLSLLFISHDLQVVEYLCDEVVEM